MAADPYLRARFDADAFAGEQRRLGQFWTCLGFASDLRRDDDRFRATLGGRSVFIPRFGDDLRDFENRGAHRSYRLRRADRGNGPILCGFHLWRQDSEGVAAIHPASSGPKRRYLPRKGLNHAAFGTHSAYFPGEGSGTPGDWAALPHAGPRGPVGYRIIPIFAGMPLTPAIRALGQSFRHGIPEMQVPPGFDPTEARVAWFNEAYAAAMRDDTSPP